MYSSAITDYIVVKDDVVDIEASKSAFEKALLGYIEIKRYESKVLSPLLLSILTEDISKSKLIDSMIIKLQPKLHNYSMIKDTVTNYVEELISKGILTNSKRCIKFIG
jgi:hypothetical protein